MRRSERKRGEERGKRRDGKNRKMLEWGEIKGRWRKVASGETERGEEKGGERKEKEDRMSWEVRGADTCQLMCCC